MMNEKEIKELEAKYTEKWRQFNLMGDSLCKLDNLCNIKDLIENKKTELHKVKAHFDIIFSDENKIFEEPLNVELNSKQFKEILNKKINETIEELEKIKKELL